MIKTPVVVKTEEDFDGRPIALLVQEASQYASTIYIQVGEELPCQSDERNTLMQKVLWV